MHNGDRLPNFLRKSSVHIKARNKSIGHVIHALSVELNHLENKRVQLEADFERLWTAMNKNQHKLELLSNQVVEKRTENDLELEKLSTETRQITAVLNEIETNILTELNLLPDEVKNHLSGMKLATTIRSSSGRF